MKKIPTMLLQSAIVLVGIAVLAFMFVEPHFEGRNANATLFQIYFNDAFLAYAYASSIAFFAGLYQAYRLAGYAGRNELFSERSLRALRVIRRCALALVGFVAAPIAYLMIVRPDDDIAGGVSMGLFLILISVGVAIAATVFGKKVQRELTTGLERV